MCWWDVKPYSINQSITDYYRTFEVNNNWSACTVDWMPVCPVLYIFFDASLSIVNFSTSVISFELFPECHPLSSCAIVPVCCTDTAAFRKTRRRRWVILSQGGLHLLRRNFESINEFILSHFSLLPSLHAYNIFKPCTVLGGQVHWFSTRIHRSRWGRSTDQTTEGMSKCGRPVWWNWQGTSGCAYHYVAVVWWGKFSVFSLDCLSC